MFPPVYEGLPVVRGSEPEGHRASVCGDDRARGKVETATQQWEWAKATAHAPKTAKMIHFMSVYATVFFSF